MSMLLDLTLKVSLVVSLAIGATWLMRRQSAAVRHLILAAAIACGAASPLLGLVVPSWSVALAGLTNQLPEQRAASSSAPIGDRAAPVPSAAGAEASVSLEVRGPARARAATVSDRVLPIWLAGIGAGVFTLLVGLARLRWLESRSTPLESGAWVEMAAEIARGYGLSRPPRLLQSGHPSLLATWGWRRSKVILPADAPSWPVDRIRVVLGHELAHVRRRDWLVQMAAEAVRSVYWFNPILWIGCRRLRQESEQACDDAVLRMGVEGTAYAQHLLDLARAVRSHHHTWLPAAAIARPSSLERRVDAMLNARVNRDPVNPWVATLAVVALLGVALPIAGLSVFAQARFATVSGTVADETGGLLTDVTLVLTNDRARTRHEVRTNGAGLFEFVGLPAGDYTLEARAPAFEAFRDRLALSVGETLHRNLALRLGTVEETITVAGDTEPRPRPAEPREAPRAPSEARLQRGTCANPALGGCIAPPIKVRDVRPRFPAGLQESGASGTVLLEATIGVDGRVAGLKTVSTPHPELDQLAIDAVRQWEFAPTIMNGQTVETRMMVNVNFGIPPPPPPAPPRP
jgi:TonB family protein